MHLPPPGADGGNDRAGDGVVHLLDLETLVDKLYITVGDLLDLLGAGLKRDGKSLDPGMLRPIRRESTVCTNEHLILKNVAF